MDKKEREEIISDAKRLWENTNCHYDSQGYLVPEWGTHEEIINQRYWKLMYEESQKLSRDRSH